MSGAEGRNGDDARRDEAREGAFDGETSRYLEMFVDTHDTDWESLASGDPSSSAEIDFLATMDRIRKAHAEVGPGSSVAESAGSAAADDDAATRSESPPETAGARAPERIGAYTIRGELGEGGFARIYEASDEKTGRTVALKVLKSRVGLSDQLVRRFLREARAMAAIEHENIVRIFHVLDDEATLGLSMELIRGRSLAQRLELEGPLPPSELARVGIALCRALAAVHRSGFIHRDIKAENVMEEDGGRIVLMDFGMTRSLSPEQRVTATGVLVGTPVAMAPEQYEFKDPDERTDVYGLGCLLWHLAAGSRPIHGTSMEEIRRKVLAGDVPDLLERRSDLPRPLREVIRKAMSVSPGRRYASAEDMERALARWLETQQPREATSAPALTNRFPTPVLVLLGAILLALLGIFGVLIHLALRDG